MKTIYIVEGQTGEYSDHREWPVAAYETEAEAQKHTMVVSDWARDKRILDDPNQAATYSYDRDKIKNPYDPGMQLDYTGVRYHCYPVRLYSELKEFQTVERLL